MTKFYISSEEDRKFIDNSFDYLAKLIFGSKHKDDIDTFEKRFLEKVEEVHIYAQSVVNKYVNANTPGQCSYDENTKKWRIDMRGYLATRASDRKFVEHEGVHEFCHAFVDILPEFIKTKSMIKKGILRENEGGMIAQKDPTTKKYVHTHYYGKMFNETMMDIISAMAINQFAPDITNTTIDDMLDNNYKNSGNAETGYTFFTTITRLVISAFSNVDRGNFRYQDVADLGESIFKLNTQMKDGTYRRANDFLYGIVFDPLHIEREFDKYVGQDAYRSLNMVLDYMFAKGKEISKDNMKLAMGLIADFCNKKRADYLNNGLLEQQEADNMIYRFNAIWNSMCEEYGISFTRQEIEDIYSRAKKFMDEYSDKSTPIM